MVIKIAKGPFLESYWFHERMCIVGDCFCINLLKMLTRGKESLRNIRYVLRPLSRPRPRPQPQEPQPWPWPQEVAHSCFFLSVSLFLSFHLLLSPFLVQFLLLTRVLSNVTTPKLMLATPLPRRIGQCIDLWMISRMDMHSTYARNALNIQYDAQ